MVRPRGLIFVIYSYFLILYTVNLCLSFSINREKERKKIRERISAITDPVKREEKLIEMTIDEKVEAEERQADLLADLNRKLGAMEQDKNTIARYARRLACPTKIRHYIERFTIEHLDAEIHFKTTQGNIVTEINNEFRSIFKVLPDAVKQLRSVARSKTSSEKDQFGPAWLFLTKYLPHLEKRTKVNQGQESTTTISLRNAIMELISAADVEKARTIWKEQCSYWEARPEEISPEDNKTLNFVAYEAIIPSLIRRTYFKNENEREYAKDFIQLEINKKSRVVTNQYKDCALVLYFSDDEEIIFLRGNITAKYPHLPRYERIHKYCQNFGRLWNEVSVVDEHTAGAAPPDDSCIPHSTDFGKYIDHLVRYKKGDLAYVAGTLQDV